MPINIVLMKSKKYSPPFYKREAQFYSTIIINLKQGRRLFK